MATELRQRALLVLRQALNQSLVEFRDGQSKAIATLFSLLEAEAISGENLFCRYRY